MKLRKFITLTAGAALFSALAFSVAACGDGDKGGNTPPPPEGVRPVPTVNSVDTFVGTASDKAFSNEEVAVKEFFRNELLGDYVGYKNNGTLSAAQVNGLDLADAANVKTVHAVTVNFNSIKFSDGEETTGVYTSDESNYDSTYQTYAIEYNDGSYKYYSPRPDNGERLTKSYFYSFIDASKYANCVAIQTTDRQSWGEYVPDGGSAADMVNGVLERRVYTRTYEAYPDLLRYNETRKYYEKIDGEMKPVEDEDEDDGPIEYSYLAKRGNMGFMQYRDGGSGDWYYIYDEKYFDGLVGYHDAPSYSARADWNTALVCELLGDMVGDLKTVYSVLEKTPTGFKATAEAFDLIGFDGEPTELYLNFDVEDGKIVNTDFGAVWEEDGEQIYQKYRTEVKDFGKTEAFALPDDLSDSLDAYIGELDENDASHSVANAEAWAAAFDYSGVSNYCKCYGISKVAMIEDPVEHWQTQETYYSVGTQIIRDGDACGIVDAVYARDWADVNEREVTYKYSSGGDWYAQKPTDSATWENERLPEWSEPVASTAPDTALFAELDEVINMFDEFVYTADSNYQMLAERDGVEYLYTVEIENGKVISIRVESSQASTYTDGQTVALHITESIDIRDVGTAQVNKETLLWQ